jgi:hypothetical protein
MYYVRLFANSAEEEEYSIVYGNGICMDGVNGLLAFSLISIVLYSA